MYYENSIDGSFFLDLLSWLVPCLLIMSAVDFGVLVIGRGLAWFRRWKG